MSFWQKGMKLESYSQFMAEEKQITITITGKTKRKIIKFREK